MKNEMVQHYKVDQMVKIYISVTLKRHKR